MCGNVNMYEVTDFLDNDLRALMSGLLYVQQREPSSINLSFLIVYFLPYGCISMDVLTCTMLPLE